MDFILDRVVCRHGQLPCRLVANEGIIVSTERGQATVVNEVGYALWSWIDGKRTGRDLLRMLCEQFAVNDAIAQDDLENFLEQLHKLKLIKLF